MQMQIVLKMNDRNENVIIKFKNGSYIKTLPADNASRGKRSLIQNMIYDFEIDEGSDVMTVRDILPKTPIETIMVRVFLPEHVCDFEGEDTLFGYCGWDGENLISHDGDSYNLNDEIVKYTFDTGIDEVGLIYWEKTGEWK